MALGVASPAGFGAVRLRARWQDPVRAGGDGMHVPSIAVRSTGGCAGGRETPGGRRAEIGRALVADD